MCTAPSEVLATADIDGPSLLARLSDGGPLDAQEARALGAGLAEALRDIHRAGLVHRDLKPGNVLPAADGPRLIDFGIIRAEDGEGLTETGYLLGSVGYMAPEQAAGGEATRAADVSEQGTVRSAASAVSTSSCWLRLGRRWRRAGRPWHPC